MVVEKQAEPDQPGRPQPAMMRQDEAKRPDDVRSGAEQNLALQQRFADEPELVVFEIAQAAVDQFRGSGGRCAGEIAFVAEEYRQPAPGGVAGDAAAVDPAADDRNVEGRLAHLPSPGFALQHSCFAAKLPGN